MEGTTIIRSDDNETATHDWGYITFFASSTVGPSREQSLGKCVIYPGKALPKHYHPNCSEVVHVLQGHITHTASPDEVAELYAGDTIVVSTGFAHQARNVGEKDAVLLISFSSARREFVVVED